MEHRPVEDLRARADVVSVGPGAEVMSRRDRLERWADLLDAEPARRLRSLGEIEYRSPDERDAMRANGSPLTVAFDDPVLRANGLSSDRLGDAVAFFGLSEGQAHRLLCSCMNGWSMASGTTARRVRRIAAAEAQSRAAIWLGAGLLFGAPTLLYWLA